VTPTLRPMNLGEILDRGVQIFRAQPLVFLGLAAIPGMAQLPIAFVPLRNSSIAVAGSAPGRGVHFVALMFLSVVHLILAAVSSAAFCLAASRINHGEAVTAREAFGTFTSKAGRLVGIRVLQLIIAGWPFIIVVFIAVVVAIIAGRSTAALYWQVPVWILGSIPSIALYTRYALAFPATAIEGLSAFSSIDRSVKLGEGGRWRICFGFLVPTVPSLMLTLGTSALIGHFKTHSPLLAGSPLAAAWTRGGVNLIAAMVFSPYSAIVRTLLYYDQRIRHEGYDVERMMDAAGLNASATLPPASPWTQFDEDRKGDA
jgi:hypothetical protein